jgi:hypothetical protein
MKKERKLIPVLFGINHNNVKKSGSFELMK